MIIAYIDMHAARFIFGRIVLPIFLSAIVTLACFFIMQMLIFNVPDPMEIENIRLSANIVAFNRSEKPREIRNRLERLIPSEPPQTPDDKGKFPIEMTSSIKGALRIYASLSEIINVEVSHFSFTSPISDLVPIRVVHPIYPFKALIREIEGEVLIEFTVAANGSVLNPRVVAATPQRIFNKAAIRAIKKFLFRAPSLDGISYQVPAMRVIFHFRLEDELTGVAMFDSDNLPVDDLN